MNCKDWGALLEEHGPTTVGELSRKAYDHYKYTGFDHARTDCYKHLISMSKYGEAEKICLVKNHINMWVVLWGTPEQAEKYRKNHPDMRPVEDLFP